jgi:hypothetical protein
MIGTEEFPVNRTDKRLVRGLAKKALRARGHPFTIFA